MRVRVCLSAQGAGSAGDGMGKLDCKVADFGLHVMLSAVEQDKDVQNLCASPCSKPYSLYHGA